VIQTEHQLSLDTQAILLLCGHFGKKTETNIKPLTPSEYARFAQWLQAQQMRPADLLEAGSVVKMKHFVDKTITVGRLQALLMRGGALALAIEAWTNKGLWVISRGDQTYPAYLKKQLGQAAPPIFYGVGQPALLQKGGIAVVGSRDIDKQITEFTKLIAKKSAQQRITVISGGARGVDTEAMITALIHGGTAVGILADSLIRASVAGKYRDALREERLVLISPFDPSAGFNVGNAMARNKYIYTLSDWAVVVNSGYQEGGTWAGAQENLKAGWVPLFVRQDKKIPKGNQALLQQGAIALDEKRLQEMTDLRQQLSQLTEIPPPQVTETEPTKYQPVEKGEREKEKGERREIIPESIEAVPNAMIDLFEVVLPYLKRQLITEKTESELAEGFNLHSKQLKIWLARAVEMGIIKKLTKPVRYIINDVDYNQSEQEKIQPSLFG
jgi:predicted Rossmann fold nucleotide-binding protein DprA/Smf involved in DNA uptake